MKSTIHDRISEIVEHFGNGKNTVIASKLGVTRICKECHAKA